LLTRRRVPALFTFHLTADNTLEPDQVLRLSGNALSLVTEASTPEKVLVSVDNIHKPGSITELRDSTEDSISPFQTFGFQQGGLVQDSFRVATVEEGEVPEGAASGLRNLLYSLENLRKRDGEERGGEDGEGAAMVDDGVLQENE
jgi:tRNA (guanine-N(7)-)-methyltransferase subunit TRM82